MAYNTCENPHYFTPIYCNFVPKCFFIAIIPFSGLSSQEGCASYFPFLARNFTFENAEFVLQKVLICLKKVLSAIWRQIFVYMGNETEAETESVFIGHETWHEKVPHSMAFLFTFSYSLTVSRPPNGKTDDS